MLKSIKVCSIVGMESIKIFRIEYKEIEEYKERLRRTKLISLEIDDSEESPF